MGHVFVEPVDAGSICADVDQHQRAKANWTDVHTFLRKLGLVRGGNDWKRDCEHHQQACDHSCNPYPYMIPSNTLAARRRLEMLQQRAQR